MHSYRGRLLLVVGRARVRRMAKTSFAEEMKRHQLSWALANGVTRDMLEADRPWVLKKEHRERNLFDPSWWRYIAGQEHRWASALNSSQCFAVNVFAPMAEDSDLAKAVWARIYPHRHLDPADTVTVEFEHTPEGAGEWLGERRQNTQVDVFFTVRRGGATVGQLLVEVKFTEAEFGECRGAKPPTATRAGNPDRSRCLDLGAIVTNPSDQCWLVETEGRLYWDIMSSPTSSFELDRVALPSPCPFRHGLYQLMRNRALADAIVANTEADWADVAVCLHPQNAACRVLSEPVGGDEDVIRAFNSIVPNDPVPAIDPGAVLQAIADENTTWTKWAATMQSRYEL